MNEGAAEEAAPVRPPAAYARLLEALDAAVYVLDPDGTVTFANDALCALTGYDRERVLGAGPDLVLEDEVVAAFEREIREKLSADTESFTVAREVSVRRADGGDVPCRAHLTVLRDQAGELLGSVGILRDLSARERRLRLLARLQETTQSLMQADSRATVGEVAADAAVDRLGFDACVVRLYDAEARTLEPVGAAGTDVPDADALAAVDLETGPAAAAFTSGEGAVYDDGTEGVVGADGRAVAVQPIGTHGTLELAAGPAGRFDDVDRRIAELLATNAAAASNRARREEELRAARERVAAIVERIEGVVADTIEVLVGATTREEVERGVVERLAATAPYTAAWIARPDVRETELAPVEHAGGEPAPEAAVDLSGETPGAVAYRTGTTQVLEGEDLAAAEPSWCTATAGEGVAAVAAIPLVHERTSYGVLFVCTERAAALDERELVVLEALGRAVAHGIDAIESGRILETDEVVELGVALEGATVLESVAAATGAAFATAGAMSGAEGGLRLFLTASGAEPEAVADALAAEAAVTEASLVAELEEEALFDVTLGDSPVADLVEGGAVPKRVEATASGTRLSVEVPDQRAAREAFATLEERADSAELVGFREHERPVRTRQEFRAALAARFTDRQETALRTAFHGGYFDWPRGADGDELAGAMGVARPTYHQHLRAAQRKTFEELFETGADRGD